MKVTSIALSALLLLGLCGCGKIFGGNAAANLVGKWKGSLVAESGHESDPDVKMAQSFAGSIAFEFKADKTFTATVLVPLEGTYEVAGSTVTCHLSKAMGMDTKAKADEKPMVFDIGSDGKTLTAHNDDSAKGKSTGHAKLTLTKEG